MGSTNTASRMWLNKGKGAKKSNHRTSKKSVEYRFLLQHALQYPNLPYERQLELGNLSLVHKDINARNELILHNLRFVIKVALEYHDLGVDVQDLIQEGICGILKAAERYDPKFERSFLTFADWYINQAISRGLKGSNHTIKVTVYYQELCAKLRKIKHQLTEQLEREPSEEEIAREAGMSIKKVKRAFIFMQYKTLYFSDLASPDSSSTENMDFLTAPQPREPMAQDIRIVATEELEAACKSLRNFHASVRKVREKVFGDRNKSIFLARYGLLPETFLEPQTLRTVGTCFGMTHQGASLIIQKGWSLMKNNGFPHDSKWVLNEVRKVRALHEITLTETKSLRQAILG